MGISTILSNILISAGPFTGLQETLISFLLLIDAKIYGLFAQIYTLYIQLARAQIFDISAFDFFINNIYVIFGVIALFILAFFLLQGMVNPDENAAGTKTIKQFIIRLVMAVFLTFLIPTLFDFLYDFQDSIISIQAIPKLVLSEAKPLDSTGLKLTDENNNPINESICDSDNSISCNVFKNIESFDVVELSLNAQGYGMAYHVLKGFIHPTNLGEDVTTKASKYFNKAEALPNAVLNCAVAAGGGFVLSLALPYLGLPIAYSAGKACLAGGALSYGASFVGFEITAESFRWSNAETLMQYAGDFDTITYFAGEVLDGTMTYTPLVSTVAGIILLYMIFSFCLDLGIRSAKLILYQIMAPISFLISTIPSKKDLMSKWFKAVLTTWLEVFIRIFCVCGAALLIRELNLNAISGLGPLAQAIIVLGLVIFAKQLPKIFSDLTGIDSGNLKLGIKEKLAAGGAFIAGAAIGGGLTALTRNAISAGRNVKNKYRESKNSGKGTIASLWSTKGALGAGILSTAAGATSGLVRGGKSGLGAKNFSDMKGAAGTGAAKATSARDKRAAYKADHGGKFIGLEKDANGKTHLTGTAFGHAKDAVRSAGEWAGIGVGDTVLGYYDTAAQSTNAFNDLSESTYKKKQEYMDQNSVVKALQSRLDATIKAGATAEVIKDLEKKLQLEDEALKNMQRKMAAKKADVISIAATRLSVDQRTNYLNDKELTKAYREAIFKGFEVAAEDYGRSHIEQIEIEKADGTKEKRNQRVLIDDSGVERRLSVNETSILDAMLNGGEVKDEWITEDNVIKIQEAIDKANIGRQHIKTGKEREHIVRTSNRSAQKKDK